MNADENHNEENNVPSVPPPAYEESIATENEPSVPVISGTGVSMTPTVPSYAKPLSYPYSSDNLPSAPIAIPMVNLEQREPPPAYNPEFETVTTVTMENTAITASEARNIAGGKCIKITSTIVFVAIVIVFMLVAFPEWFFYY